MSFTVSVTEGFDLDTFLRDFPGLESEEVEMLGAAIDAAEGLAVLFPQCRIEIKGHANPGHGHVEGTQDGWLQIIVTQEIPAPEPENPEPPLAAGAAEDGSPQTVEAAPGSAPAASDENAPSAPVEKAAPKKKDA